MSKSSRDSIESLYGGGLLGVQLELSRRDITNHHSCAEARKLQREAPRACPRIQHTIAVANVLAEKPEVHLEPYAVHGADVEALPLTHAVLVVEACDVLGVVRNARHCGEHMAPTYRETHRSPAPACGNVP